MIEAQKAIIKRKGKMLVLKRSPEEKYFAGYWELPGGKLEGEEAPEEVLEREVEEETGLDIEVREKAGRYRHGVRESEHPIYRFTLYQADLVSSPEIELSREHSEFRWLTEEEARDLKLEPYLESYLEDKTSNG